MPLKVAVTAVVLAVIIILGLLGMQGDTNIVKTSK